MISCNLDKKHHVSPPNFQERFCFQVLQRNSPKYNLYDTHPDNHHVKTIPQSVHFYKPLSKFHSNLIRETTELVFDPVRTVIDSLSVVQCRRSHGILPSLSYYFPSPENRFCGQSIFNNKEIQRVSLISLKSNKRTTTQISKPTYRLNL